jgi:hypothetical protein
MVNVLSFCLNRSVKQKSVDTIIYLDVTNSKSKLEF